MITGTKFRLAEAKLAGHIVTFSVSLSFPTRADMTDRALAKKIDGTKKTFPPSLNG